MEFTQEQAQIAHLLDIIGNNEKRHAMEMTRLKIENQITVQDLTERIKGLQDQIVQITTDKEEDQS